MTPSVRIFVADNIPITVIKHVKGFEVGWVLSDYRPVV
jgi:hypothetical protein